MSPHDEDSFCFHEIPPGESSSHVTGFGTARLRHDGGQVGPRVVCPLRRPAAGLRCQQRRSRRIPRPAAAPGRADAVAPELAARAPRRRPPRRREPCDCLARFRRQSQRAELGRLANGSVGACAIVSRAPARRRCRAHRCQQPAINGPNAIHPARTTERVDTAVR